MFKIEAIISIHILKSKTMQNINPNSVLIIGSLLAVVTLALILEREITLTHGISSLKISAPKRLL